MKKLFFSGFIILILLSISCSIKDFEAPEFDKKIQLPLMNETYYMADLADTTDDFMLFVENDTMMFSINDDIETEYVDEEDLMIEGQTESIDSQLGDELKIDSREESTTVEVGDDLTIDGRERIIEQHLNRIEVEETGDAYANIVILEFASEAIDEPVEPIYDEVIPPFYDFEAFNQDFSLFQNDNIDYVIIDTGSVYVEFLNNTELSLSSDLGQEFQMHFEFYTNGSATADDGTYMFTHYIDNVISPGETESLVIPFDGNTIYMSNYLKCFLTTDGSGGPIGVDEDDSFEVTLSVGNMTVTEANAIIESASVDHEDSISLSDDEIQVIYAEIESCIGNITLENELSFDIDSLRLEFHQLLDPEGANLVIMETGFLQGSTLEIPLDLQDHTIQASSGDPIDSLFFSIHAVTDPPTGYTVINQEDMVVVNINFGQMSFSEFTGIIDQTSEDSNSIGIEDEDIQIQSAAIEEGSLSLDFSGIGLQSPSSISILFDEIKDPNNNFEPLEIIIEDFNNFQYDLTDHLIELTDEQMLNYHTSVNLDQEITLSTSDIVTAEIVLSELFFSSITGRFGSFEIEDENSTEIDSTGEFKLFYAEILESQIHIDISEDNYSLPFGAVINLDFAEIYTDNGQPLAINIHCPGDTIIDLSGYSLGNYPDSDIVIDSLHYTYTVITDEVGDEFMTLYSDSEVLAFIEISDIIFQEIRGVLDNKQIEIEDIIEDIDMDDLPDSLEGLLEFQAVQLHFSIQNQTGFNCQLNMNITGSNDSGESVEILMNETILADATTDIYFGEEDGVNELLNLIPTQIAITNAFAIIGDGITPGNITLNDSISGFYEVITPLQFIISDHQVTESADPFELSDDDQDIIEDNLDTVKLIIETENKLPLGAELAIYFSTDSLLVYTNPQLLIDDIGILPAEIIDGHSGQPSLNQFVIELSTNNSEGENDFEVFLDRENQDVYAGIELFIIGTDGEPVTIFGSDNIKVIGYLEAIVHISDTEE